MLLDGLVCVVTGAASPRGIGFAAAHAMAEQGARIALLDLNLGSTITAATAINTDALALACDVTDRTACDNAVGAIVERFGSIDVLINNAGISQPLGLLEVGQTDYDAVTDVSLRGTLNMSQAVAATLLQARSGSIINMSSVSAQRGGGIFGGPHYAAAKAGVAGHTRAIARALGPSGIRVNAIAPGLIDTDIIAGKLSDEMRSRVLDSVPLGRLGEPGDVAGICVFLASPLSAYVTGATIDVNGGMHIH